MSYVVELAGSIIYLRGCLIFDKILGRQFDRLPMNRNRTGENLRGRTRTHAGRARRAHGERARMGVHGAVRVGSGRIWVGIPKMISKAYGKH